MLEGFWRTEMPQVVTVPTVPRCGACSLYKRCHSPKMPVHGEGRKEVLVVGEAPGESEDRQNRPFVGVSGQYLRSTLRKIGIDLDRDCWTTNAIVCRPADADGRNRTPTDKEIGYCRPSVNKAVRELKPKTVVLLGTVPVKSVVGPLWREDVGPITRWVGWRIPCREHDCWLCPNWHPSYLVREENNPVLAVSFERTLRRAFAKKKRPYGGPAPDLTKQVRLTLDPAEACESINEMVRRSDGTPVAFDYETDRLKPHHPSARIVCCALSDGRETVAFPWMNPAIDAMISFLHSPVPKVAQNLKFEHAWTKCRLAVTVKNWFHDTMVGQHVLDNRQGATGLKFQAFVRLGVGPYDAAVREYLKAKGGNAKNRVKHCDLRTLLLYCGMDALLEWEIAKQQREEMGLGWPT